MRMWVPFNNNPFGKKVGDCAVRAVSKALGIPWNKAYSQLTLQGYTMGDMPSSNSVISALLKRHGFVRESIPNECPDCYTLGEFADEHPRGTFVVFMNNHVAVVQNGDVYDAWDSTQETPILYWRKS